MKQVVQNYKTGELKVDEVPAPMLYRNGVLVKNHYSLISAGTEKSTVDMAKKSLVGKAKARPDLVKKVISQVQKNGFVDTAKMVMGRLDTRAALGYSCAGVIAGVGDQVNGLKTGDRVACAGQNYASHAETVVIPSNLVVRVPDSVDLQDASYVAVGAIALQGVRQAEPRLGEIVAVIGLGLLGQIVVQMLKANGCRVVATDIDENKIALAKEFGADEAVGQSEFEGTCSGISQGYGVDSVIITASTKSNEPIETAGIVCRKKGRVVVVGAVGMQVPREPYYLKELDLRLSTSYGPGRYDVDYEEKGVDYPYGYVRWTEQRNMSAFLELIAEGKLNIKALTSHDYAIEKAEEAYKLISEQSEDYLGITLNYPSENSDRSKCKIKIAEGSAISGVQLGLIGVGNHIKDMILPHLRNSDNVNIKAICTNTGINAKAVAEKQDAEYCTTDYNEILADESIHAIVIGTRHDSHAEIAVNAIKAGKHVLLEKPLCLSKSELKDVRTAYEEISEDNNVIVQLAFNRSYSSHAEKIIEFFGTRNNPLTMVYRVNAGAIPADHWIQDEEIGGGRIIGECCHFIDFMRTISGSSLKSVFAMSIGNHDSGITADKAIISLEFSDGSIGTLVYCADGDKSLAKERFEAFSDGKSVVMNDFSTTEFYKSGKKEVYKSSKLDKGFQQEVDYFLSRVKSGKSAYDEFLNGYEVTLATIAAVESMKDRNRHQL